MIQNRRNILLVFIVIAVMVTGYGLNSQLDEVPCAIELSTENDRCNGGLQSDSDAHEDENSNHASQIICITENLSTSFVFQIPSLLIFQSYSVWQPPKTC
jgi:hypothetical protein